MAKKVVERPAPRIIEPRQPNMPRYYEWDSESEPGRKHRTMVFNGEVKGCTCRGAKHGCWHQEYAARLEWAMKHESGAEENDVTTEPTTTAVAVSKPQLNQEAVVQYQPRDLTMDVGKFDLMWKIAQTVHKGGAGMLPDNIRTPEAAMAVMMAGLEMGFQPFVSLRQVFIVNGKTQLMSEGLLTVMKDNDPTLDIEWHESSAIGAEATLWRHGKPVMRLRYDETDRKRAGQGSKGGPWVGYAPDMYRWAVIKRLARFGAPELINLTPRMQGDDDFDDTLPPPRSALSQAIAAGEVSAAAASEGTEPPDFVGDPDAPAVPNDEATDGDIAPEDEATDEATNASDGPIWASWEGEQLTAQKVKLHDRLLRLKRSMTPGDYGTMARGIAKDLCGDAKNLDLDSMGAEAVYEAINRTVIAEGGDVAMYWGD